MPENFIPIVLPSKCKVYDEVDASQIAIRVLKGKDEKLIAETTHDNIDRKFVAILKNVLRGIDPVKLTLGDRKFVLLWLAINSYNKEFPVELICDICLKKISVNVDLSTFEVNELPDEYVQPYEVKLTDGRKIYLRLFTVEDELRVADYEKNGSTGWILRYALSVVDKEKSLSDNVALLEDMNVGDLALVRAFHEKYDHGPVMETSYVCPTCGGNGKVAVPFRIEMVFPYGAALKKHFGKAV